MKHDQINVLLAFRKASLCYTAFEITSRPQILKNRQQKATEVDMSTAREESVLIDRAANIGYQVADNSR